MAELRPYTGVQKQSTSARKVGVTHTLRDCINVKFQVSVQINEFLLCNKSKQTRYKYKKEVGITIKVRKQVAS